MDMVIISRQISIFKTLPWIMEVMGHRHFDKLSEPLVSNPTYQNSGNAPQSGSMFSLLYIANVSWLLNKA